MLQLTYRSLFLFSLPSIFSSLLEPFASLVDTALVGNLNTSWLAALALATTITNSFSWVFNFLVHVSTENISQIQEDNDISKKAAKIQVSFMMGLLVGLFSTLFLYLLRDPLYSLVGVSKPLYQLVETYFVIRVFGHTFSILYTTFLSIMRGQGKVKESFFILFLTTGLNIFVSWYFLYRLNWGVKGVAYGTIFSSFLGMIICAVLIFFTFPDKKYLMKWQITKSEWLHFSTKSGNLFIRSLLLTSVFFISTRLGAWIGIVSLAAHQVLLQVWLFSSYFIDGVAITANIYGARFMAKKDFESLAILNRVLLRIGVGLGLIFSIIYFCFQKLIWGVFTSDFKVVLILSSLWPLIWASQIPNAVAFVYDGLLFGTGNFRYIKKMMLGGTLLIFIPIASATFYYKSLYPLWLALIALNFHRWYWGRKKMLGLIQRA